MYHRQDNCFYENKLIKSVAEDFSTTDADTKTVKTKSL